MILHITWSGRSLMYSRKRVGSWSLGGTPALTRCSCEDFTSRTIWSHLVLRKDEIRPNILQRRPACQNLLEALDISSATAQVASDLLKPRGRGYEVKKKGLSSNLACSPHFRCHFSPWWRAKKNFLKIFIFSSLLAQNHIWVLAGWKSIKS